MRGGGTWEQMSVLHAPALPPPPPLPRRSSFYSPARSSPRPLFRSSLCVAAQRGSRERESAGSWGLLSFAMRKKHCSALSSQELILRFGL